MHEYAELCMIRQSLFRVSRRILRQSKELRG
ncbi:hypothetical protein SGPA1_20279 [Streptomyces misionensis JCM 4497]